MILISFGEGGIIEISEAMAAKFLHALGNGMDCRGVQVLRELESVLAVFEHI